MVLLLISHLISILPYGERKIITFESNISFRLLMIFCYFQTLLGAGSCTWIKVQSVWSFRLKHQMCQRSCHLGAYVSGCFVVITIKLIL